MKAIVIHPYDRTTSSLCNLYNQMADIHLIRDYMSNGQMKHALNT